MTFSITYPLVWQLKRVVSSIHAPTHPHKKWGATSICGPRTWRSRGSTDPLDFVAQRPLERLWNDSHSKMATTHPVWGQFGLEFSAFVIIAELWRPGFARPGNFVNIFGFLWKFSPLKLSLLRGSRPKCARASPHIWLAFFQISSKSVHFRRSYRPTREDRFCPVEYLQYRFFEAIQIFHVSEDGFQTQQQLQHKHQHTNSHT